MAPAHGVDFLSCDSTFVDLPMDSRKEMKGLPTLAEHFATDRLPVLHPLPPKAPFPLCKLRTHTVSLLGCSFFMVLVLVAAGVSIWHVATAQEEIKDPRQLITFISIAAIVLVAFGVVCLWGVLTGRHRLMIPFIFVSCVILFAIIGSVAVLFITLPDELAGGVSMTACILIRLIPALLVIVQAYFIFCYIRTFIFIRTRRRQQN